MLNRFVNKTAVITGAASGLGKEIARRGQTLGMNLVLVDSNLAKLQDFTQELRDTAVSKDKILSLTADVSSFKDIEHVGRETKSKFGVPNYIFNNAGISRAGFAWEHTTEEWNWFLGVNLMGVVNGIRVFTPMMLDAAKADPNFRGRVINTASMAGLVSMPLASMYNVSKHAVVTLSETLYHDLKFLTDQVSASVLCPFFVPTNISSVPVLPPHVTDSYTAEDGTVRGKTPSQAIGEAGATKAVVSGKISAEQVATIVFDAIDKDQFYIYSHPQLLGTFMDRANDVASITNPRDFYGSKPDVGDKLKIALQKAYGFQAQAKTPKE